MEINEATCLCRFGGCEVLRDGAYAESNYWSVTSTAECLDAKSHPLTSDIYIGQRKQASVETHTWKHVFLLANKGRRFTWAWRVGDCENVRLPALPSAACMPLHRKHIAHQKQLDLLVVSVRLWSDFLSHTYTHSHTHLHAFVAVCHVHTTQTPHTHPGWCSEVSESSGW